MSSPLIIDVVIPAYNEEESIGKVIEDIPGSLVRYIIVCNNGSSDRTAERAKEKGALVVNADQKGYGSACLAGLAHIKELEVAPDIVVFLDGDYSDFPQEMPLLIEPISNSSMDMVIGSRALGNMERGSMQPQQVFGNWLATTLIKIFYGYQFTDLGPFRAITYSALEKINMKDRDFGWTVEMQVKAAKMGMKTTEVPVSYRRRIGVSKVSGTIKGTILAGQKIIWTIFKYL